MDDPAQLTQYGKTLLFGIVGTILVAFTFFLSKLIAPNKPNPLKNSTYECGEESRGSAWVQFNPRFYIVALVFLIFELELIFIFPWSVIFGQEKFVYSDVRWAIFALTEMAVFIGMLIIGLVYIWRKGDLVWLKPNTKKLRSPANIPAAAYEAINTKKYEVIDYKSSLDLEKSKVEQRARKVPSSFKPRFKKGGGNG